MSGSRRTAQFVTAGAVVLAWATVYVGVLLVSPPAYDPTDESAAKVNRELAMPRTAARTTCSTGPDGPGTPAPVC